MLYALVMLITINGHTDRYVLDHAQTASDCTAALSHAHAARLIDVDGVHATAAFRCEPMRNAR